MAGDSNFNNVVLRLPFDGPTNGVDIRDRSNTRKTITVSGNAKLSTTASKFGGSSLALDGTGDYLTIADHADLDLGGTFTLEGWFRFSSTSDMYLFDRYNNSANKRSILCTFQTISTVKSLQFIVSPAGISTGTVSVVAAFTPIVGQFYHIAFVNTGSKLIIFVDGTSI